MFRTHYWFKQKGLWLDEVSTKTREDIVVFTKEDSVSQEQLYNGLMWRFNGMNRELHDSTAIYSFWRPFSYFLKDTKFLGEMTYKK
ncbi:MAG: hypothetical protein KAS32_12455 [Candidatus Peribacteraceae bacterium]|nr:hypothetical protein [Candidatus Peribacteraceae bacterium]